MRGVTAKSTAQLITLESGWQAWLMPDGRVRPHIRGAEDPPAPTPPPAPQPPAPPAPPTPPAPPAPDPNAPDLTALQTAIDAAKANGSTEALQPLMALVGAATPEALQEWVTTAHTAQRAQLSDLERREQDATAREAAAVAREAEAARVLLNTRIQSALIIAGAPVETAPDLIALVAVASDADDAAIAAAVDATKTKFAGLFTPGATPPTPPGPPAPSSRAPGAPPPTPPGPTDPLAAGRERAKKAAAARQGATKEDLINQFTPGRSPLLPAS